MVVAPGTAPSVWWVEAGEEAPRPALTGEITADVAVIGGGLTGMSTAWHLSRRCPGLGIVVLEAGRIAGGASGRSGGQVLHWINGMDPTTPEATRRVREITGQGIDLVEALEKVHGVHAGFVRGGGLAVVRDARRAEEAARRVEQLNAWGVPLQFLTGAALDERLRLTGAVGAVFDADEGRVNGVRLVRGLARLAEAGGVRIFEGSPVTRVEEGAQVVLSTPGGVVRARALVLGTNGYTHRLGFFRSGIFPLHSHVVASAPLSVAEQSAWGLGRFGAFHDDMDRIAYGAMSPEGRFVFGGGSNASYSYRWGNQTEWTGGDTGHRAVIDHLQRYFPAASGDPFSLRWTGTLGITMSRLFAAGVTGEHKNIYYSVGYSGHGMALAVLAGRMLTDAYVGEGERWADMPFWMRIPGGIPPEPLRWVGYHLYTRLTGRSPRRAV